MTNFLNDIKINCIKEDQKELILALSIILDFENPNIN